jgi:hypothetical protein
MKRRTMASHSLAIGLQIVFAAISAHWQTVYAERRQIPQEPGRHSHGVVIP